MPTKLKNENGYYSVKLMIEDWILLEMRETKGNTGQSIQQ
jgi:hypothetical protein